MEGHKKKITMKSLMDAFNSCDSNIMLLKNSEPMSRLFSLEGN